MTYTKLANERSMKIVLRYLILNKDSLLEDEGNVMSFNDLNIF
jgi:hypothetical protein